ncbi:MAG: hypothetical protein QXJ28_03180 [Candidatus Pacearchaeota archaeon]
MADRKLRIAILIIIILSLTLLYVLFIGPKINSYIIKKQVDAQKSVVKSIIDVAEQQGFVSLTDGERNILLVKYVPSSQPPSEEINISR